MTDSLLDVTKVLDELVDLVEAARSMPMSASCVVNRADVLGLLDDLRDRLPEAMGEAREVLEERSAVLEEGEREAEALLQAARLERARLLEETDVLRAARAESDLVLAEAADEAERMRAEVDDYVDAKLAHFEIVLTGTLEAVGRGRAKLAGTLGNGMPGPG
jgi:cell division septum initiation protein DivIVA